MPPNLLDPGSGGSVDRHGFRGAMYLPAKDWNAYQMWDDYRQDIIERELDYAKSLGLRSVRVLGSYERWRQDGPSYFARTHHFLNECSRRGISPLIILFEAPPKNRPTLENLTNRDPDTAFGVHSPDRLTTLQTRDWKGYARSPLHFARRFAQEFGDDARLGAIEVMNEPGDAQPRQDFVVDMLNEVREHAPNAVITMGCKDFHFNNVYDDRTGGALDVHQFHMNLPWTPEQARDILTDARDHKEATGKPIWLSEWQRTLEEPPSRFMPNVKSLAPEVHDALDNEWIDGAYLWGLMLKPAYLRVPRERGRYNGIFHTDGTVFDIGDARAASRDPFLDLTQRKAIPEDWHNHRFPYPIPEAEPIEQPDGNTSRAMLAFAAGLVGVGLLRRRQ